ncbi:MAG: DUF4417 domain-containing protein [Clostridiales bacterium]|nr:DUF4417 domain-containing protein [Clostridiales bacterium]
MADLQLSNNKSCATIKARKGVVDLWNAFMLGGAELNMDTDMPLCPTTTQTIPIALISWREAKRIHRKEMLRRNRQYHCDVFIHFYCDDQYFDGKLSSIWTFPKKALCVIRHFAGIIAPDFSTNADFPDPLKRWQFYRMNAFDAWVGQQGVPVIANARWGTPETWDYCFSGFRCGDMVAIGTVASGLRSLENRDQFEVGLRELIERVHPPTIVVYGSVNTSCFRALEQQGIRIVAFPSDICRAFERRCRHE